MTQLGRKRKKKSIPLGKMVLEEGKLARCCGHVTGTGILYGHFLPSCQRCLCVHDTATVAALRLILFSPAHREKVDQPFTLIAAEPAEVPVN